MWAIIETVHDRNDGYYLDQIRVILVSIVIFLNMSGVFGQATPWYVKIGIPDPVTSFISTWFVGVLRSWLLGVFFLVTGAIAARLYEGKHKGFTESRLVKLGIPSLLYVVLVNPLLVFAGRQGTTAFISFVTDEYLKFKVIGTGPLWFAIILFFCSVSLPPIAAKLKFDKIKFPSWSGIVLFGLILSAVTFAVRIWVPVGTYFWGFHLAFLPQFLVMPFVGMAAWQSCWLERTTNRQFWISFLVMLACILVWPLISSQPFNGGMTAESGVRVLWESVFLISASFVFVHGAGSWLNRRTKLWDFLTETGYGVYVLHAIVLVFVALTFGNAGSHPLALWLALSVLCAPLTFVIAWAARLLPMLKKIL